LEIECNFSDEYLAGHARRVGLAGDQTSDDTLAQLLPTIRYDVVFESDRIRDSNFDSTFRIREAATEPENARALAQFLGVTDEVAETLAQTPYLFVD
jgi:ubiquinone biosynthesis protein Coq4